MYSSLKSIRKERASLERDRVVISSMMESEKISNAFQVFEDEVFEGVSNDEIEELIEKLPESDDEDEQVERILNADSDLSIDQIFGIDAE